LTARGVFDDNFFGGSAYLQEYQYNSISQASGAIPTNVFCGATDCELASSGATALTTPTAAQIWAQIAGLPGQLNMQNLTFRVRVINSNAGALTLTGGTGVTINGTASVTNGTWREYVATVVGPYAVTLQNVGSGTP
jgi:hypothetical protein